MCLELILIMQVDLVVLSSGSAHHFLFNINFCSYIYQERKQLLVIHKVGGGGGGCTFRQSNKQSVIIVVFTVKVLIRKMVKF